MLHSDHKYTSPDEDALAHTIEVWLDLPAALEPGPFLEGHPWIDPPTARQQRRYLEAHPELLHEHSDTILNAWIAQVADDQRKVLHLRNVLALLRDARERGSSETAIRQAYVNAHGGFSLDLPPWLEEVEQQLAALRRGGEWHDLQTVVAWIDVLSLSVARVQQTAESVPEVLAALQCELAYALQQNSGVDRAQAMSAAFDVCMQALQVYTYERYPRQFADLQTMVGTIYRRGIRRRENIERGLTCYREALRVRTLEALPYEYAEIHNFMGWAYLVRTEGEQRENIEQAIVCFQEALRVWTPQAFPFESADILFNLGVAYAQRIEGEQRENAEQAIVCFQEALRVRTLEDYPFQYAATQEGLGFAFMERLTGARRENIEQAIACFQEALRVRTAEAFPAAYTNTMENLGNAYLVRIAGERRENLEQAITCFQEVLRFLTPETFPYSYASVHENLGDVYRERITGEKQENLEQASAYYQEALRLWPMNALPEDHRRVQLSRAETSAALGDWVAVHNAYTAAREAEDLLVALGAGVVGRDAILKKGRDASVRAGFALIRMGRIQDAAVAIERGRARGLAEAIEFNTADPAHIGDAERRSRYVAARQSFIAAQAALNTPLSSELDEDAQRRVNLERTASYREAKATFDAIVAEIRTARDPVDFLLAPLDAVTLLDAAERCGAGHVLVYLAATPWGGIAVAAFAANPRFQTPSRFAALSLPDLTDDLLSSLVESRLEDDADALTGGFDCAQRGNALDLLSRWSGTTLREKAAALHAACLATGHTSSLDEAAHSICIFPALAHLVAQPLDTLSDEHKGLLASTLNHAVLHQELARCLPRLANVALRPLVAWLGEEGATSLTLIPCGPLATFPLLAVPLPGGRTVGETLPATVAPSARSGSRKGPSATPPGPLPLHAGRLHPPGSREGPSATPPSPLPLHAGRLHPPGSREGPSATPPSPLPLHVMGGQRRGIYAVGNPYPTQQLLRWGEAEALTLAALGSQLGQPTVVKIQWEATRDWLLEVLKTGQVVDASCHGMFEADDFLRSRLLLANAEELTLSDLLSYQADLRGLRLLILSACQTALLDLRGARDEVHSLAAGVLQAGAESVLASLWAVDDKATYLLMVRFAQEWFPHMAEEPPAAALARAQHWLRTVTNRALQIWEAALLPSPIKVEEPHPAETLPQEDATLAQESASLMPMLVVRGRGNRFDALQAQELVQMRAEEQEPEAHPYAEPYYWAGFQVTGW